MTFDSKTIQNEWLKKKAFNWLLFTSHTQHSICDKRAKLRQLKSGGKYEKIENKYANDTCASFGLRSLIKQQTNFGLLVHLQCYADKTLTPSSLHGVFCLFSWLRL